MSLADHNTLSSNPNREEILKCKILIVEDDVVTRTMTRQVFAREGFTRLIEAENGSIGLQKLHSERPDLIIADIMMPVMNGLEFCKQVRADADEAIASTPILVQTGRHEPGDKVPIYQAGATDYLPKPIDPTELMARSIVHLEYAVLLRNVKKALSN